MISMEKRHLLSEANKAGMDTKEMAKVYLVPERTIIRLLKHERDTGSMAPNNENRGRPSTISAETIELIRKTIEEQPNITLTGLKAKLKLSLSLSAICRIIRYKLKFTAKKDSVRRQT
jgi:transposase